MFGVIIIAAIAFSAFVSYDFGSSVNTSIPGIPHLFGGSQNSVFFGGNSVISTSSISSMPAIHTTTLFPSPGATQNPSNPTSTTPTSLAQDLQPVLPSIVPGYSTFALCGNNQIVTSYDKTNMATGGDITYVTINAPSITATLMYTNGTKITTIQNDKIRSEERRVG